jgi:hypothetical protein
MSCDLMSWLAVQGETIRRLSTGATGATSSASSTHRTIPVPLTNPAILDAEKFVHHPLVKLTD